MARPVKWSRDLRTIREQARRSCTPGRLEITATKAVAVVLPMVISPAQPRQIGRN